MNKKGKESDVIKQVFDIGKSFKKSYLWKLVSKFLSVACTIILIVLVVVGSLMFYFNTKAKAYNQKGIDYTAPFGLYTIISGSMEPNVDVYDVVITMDYDISKIKVGDIITFISNWEINSGLTVTHRVVSISKNEKGEYLLNTKGDNNGTKDGGTVTQTNLVGKVIGRIPQLGKLQFFLATKMGWLMIVFIPALIVIIIDMIKIFKLYVLKNQIDKVKTPQEAEKEKTIQELQNKNKVLIEPQNKTLVSREKVKSSKDENIDTVELPKISANGKIVENTSELPDLNNKKKTKEETKTFKDIVLPADEFSYDSGKTVPIPKAKSNSKTEKEKSELPRKQLQRRK